MKSAKDMVSSLYEKIEPYGSCEKCGAQGYKKYYPARPGIHEAGYIVAYDCKCSFEEYLQQAYIEANTTLRDNLAITNMQKSNLTEIQKMQANLKFEENEKNRYAYKYVKHYYSNFSKQTAEGILLVGEAGIGKTLLAVKAAYKILQKNQEGKQINFDDDNVKIKKIYSVFFITSEELTRNMQDYLFNKDMANFGERARDVDLLVLDDLGVEAQKEYNYTHLFNVIDYRTRNNKPMIITTNLDKKHLYEKYKDFDEDARLYSRIIGNCRVLEFSDIDRRVNK